MIDWLSDELYLVLSRIASILFDPKMRTFWPHLVITLFLAFAVTIIRTSKNGSDSSRARQAIGVIFDPKIWLHKSAVADYCIYIINAILRGIISVFGLISGALSAFLFEHSIALMFSAKSLSLYPTTSALIIFSVIGLLWTDFGRFLGHYLTHKIPVLWEFHKVHHSAEVLTPATVFRIHPCDAIFLSFTSGFFLGILNSTGMFLFGKHVTSYEILGLSVAIFVFNSFGANLRHSHIWLSYPFWLHKVLISPAQHQIHHSSAQEHRDKNMGVMFAFWDRLFGTLYIPQEQIDLTLGLASGEGRDYQTVDALYFVPFQKAWSSLHSRRLNKQVKKFMGNKAQQWHCIPHCDSIIISGAIALNCSRRNVPTFGMLCSMMHQLRII